jgi:signal transduction histidine kinase
MVASVVKEEALTVDEVREILDEASQVVAYSHRLEQKSRELEAATAELRVANERLTELDRLKDDFISTVTHELRTPLTSIRAFSEILLDDPDIELAQRKNFLSIITKETARLSRLINQVLDLSKIESGAAEWQESSVDMKELVADTVAGMSQLFQEKNVRLDADLPERVPAVTADFDRIVQVLLNLLSNAIKFCDRDHGQVRIALTGHDAYLQVAVCDNGPGIGAEDHEAIFDKFRQGGDTLTGKPQGTGLGLHISRHIVERFGGKIWAESRPGEGACFYFTLPIAALPAPSLLVHPG